MNAWATSNSGPGTKTESRACFCVNVILTFAKKNHNDERTADKTSNIVGT